VSQQGCPSVVPLRTPGSTTAQELLRCLGRGKGVVHLGFKGQELGKGEVTGAAKSRGGLGSGASSIEFSRLEGLGALGIQGGVDDVGGGVKIALIVAAHQLSIHGEGHIALGKVDTHTESSLVTFGTVLRELDGGTATMSNGESALGESSDIGASLELSLEGAVCHLINQVVWARSQLNGGINNLWGWRRDWLRDWLRNRLGNGILGLVHAKSARGRGSNGGDDDERQKLHGEFRVDLLRVYEIVR
jgi:Flp pilus assembly pilin Flp